MKQLAIFTILFAFINSSDFLLAQDRKIELGIEPIYNRIFYGRDNRTYKEFARNLYGIGLVFETQVSKSKTRLQFSSGLYYFFFHSSTVNIYLVDRQYDQYNILYTDHYVKLITEIKSHNFRIPLKLSYQFKNVKISGGFLIDYELKNQHRLEAKLYPEVPCVSVDTELRSLCEGENYSGQVEKNRFSPGLEFSIGYRIIIEENITIVPNILYNIIFEKEEPAATSGFYLNHRHGIGVGCKIFINKKAS